MNRSPRPAPLLSPDELNALPLARCPDPVEVVRSAQGLRKALAALDGQALLGFDTETRPAFRKGQRYLPSLLQLAAEGRVFVFMLSELGLPEGLRALLSDPATVKAGVAVADDVAGLRRREPFEPGGFLDLSLAAKAAGLACRGLRTMAAEFLAVRISKSAQTSNWAAPTLSPAQVAYAATDAWACRELALAMSRQGRLRLP